MSKTPRTARHQDALEPKSRTVADEAKALADYTRQVAQCFDHIAEEIRASFRSNDPAWRTRRLQHTGNRIRHIMLPIIGWLEQRRPAETARLVTSRLYTILREAVECAGLDIPEFIGGTTAQSSGPVSPGAARAAALLVTTDAFKKSLMEWAFDIEAEPAGTVNSLQFNAANTPIERMRQAIAETPNGKSAKPEALIRQAKISKVPARQALRKLQSLGEYDGFARDRPSRWRK
jgi:hypothetical protein